MNNATDKLYDEALSWDDLEWLRSFWDGPIVLKGIQTVEDAKQAVALGVEGIGISNHGGRQLDDAEHRRVGTDADGVVVSCAPICGDGLLVGDEDCDDNNGLADATAVSAQLTSTATGQACQVPISTVTSAANPLNPGMPIEAAEDHRLVGHRRIERIGRQDPLRAHCPTVGLETA